MSNRRKPARKKKTPASPKKAGKTLPFPKSSAKTYKKTTKPILWIATPIAYNSEPTEGYKESINSLFEAEDDLPFKIHHEMMPSTNIAIGRNAIINGSQNVAKFQGQLLKDRPYTGLLFIDSDMKFSVDDVLNIVNLNLPVVGAKYQNRMNHQLSNAGYWSQKIGYSPSHNWIHMKAKGLQKVDWVGSGFLFVSKNVLVNMAYPWFCDMVIDAKAPDGTPISVYTTDEFGFAVKCFEVGQSIYCHCDIEIEHQHGMKVLDEAVPQEEEATEEEAEEQDD